MVHRVLTGFWKDSNGELANSPALHTQLEQALKCFGTSILTPREAR